MLRMLLTSDSTKLPTQQDSARDDTPKRLTQSLLVASQNGVCLRNGRILETVQLGTSLSVVVIFEVAAKHEHARSLPSRKNETAHLLDPSLARGDRDLLD